jgi:WD40 repeat protein
MTAVVFSPDSTQILTSGPDKTLRLWDAKSGKELQVLKGHTEPPSAWFSPDGKQALSYSLDQTIRLWDLKSGQEVRQFGQTLFGVDYAVFVAGGQRIVASTADRKIGVSETATGKLVREIDCGNFEKGTLIVTASPDGRLALVASEGWASVLVFDLSTGKEIQRYDNCRAVRCLSISADSTRAAAGSFRQGVIVFRLPPPAKQP